MKWSKKILQKIHWLLLIGWIQVTGKKESCMEYYFIFQVIITKLIMFGLRPLHLMRKKLLWLPLKESANIELILLINKWLLSGKKMLQEKGWQGHHRGLHPNRLKIEGSLMQLNMLCIEQKGVLKMLYLSRWALRPDKLEVKPWKEHWPPCLQFYQNVLKCSNRLDIHWLSYPEREFWLLKPLHANPSQLMTHWEWLKTSFKMMWICGLCLARRMGKQG